MTEKLPQEPPDPVVILQVKVFESVTVTPIGAVAVQGKGVVRAHVGQTSGIGRYSQQQSEICIYIKVISN